MRVWKTIPEDVIAEVIRKKFYVNDLPSMYHVRASATIDNSLYNCVEGNEFGKVYFAPVDVFLTRGRQAVMPDVVMQNSTSGS